MNISIVKGESQSGYYTNTSIGLATDWVGTYSLYTSYPGTPIITKALVFNGALGRMDWSWLASDTLNLTAGTYYMVGQVSSATLGVTTNKIDYLTILAAAGVTREPMTTISVTISKGDDTPAGKETKELVNTDTGTMIVSGWEGVSIIAKHPSADSVNGVVVGVEPIYVKTNAAGYAQFLWIKGQPVEVSCPSFGKTVTVDTTGLDSIDLSSYF